MVIRSWRPGLGGSVFGMYRFSTTPKDAASPGDPSDPDGDPARGTTGFGAWMRRRGFDELPQLFNILLGQMSFVGPRPLQVEDHSQLDDEQLLRYVVRPGVTSPWQLCSPPILTHAELVNLDIAYLRHWSILYDLEILVKTSRLMIRGRKTLPRLMQEDDRGAMYLTNSQKYDSTETTLPPRSQARGQRRWWHFMRR
jgi:lipopolysaccharide/colanic/teichoic acid biosynthesis glycosyltransferase